MSDTTTTITPEERARLREQADKSYLLPLDEDGVPSVGFDGLTDDRIAYIAAACNSVPRLLTALEAAEAENARLRAERDWLAENSADRPDYNDVDCAGCPERRRGYLTWTTEPPKVAGWYWRKETAAGRAHVFHFTGNWGDYGEHWESDRVCQLPLILNDNLWAGPIPAPLEQEVA